MRISTRFAALAVIAAAFLGSGVAMASADPGSGAQVTLGRTLTLPGCIAGPFLETNGWVEVVTTAGKTVLTCHFINFAGCTG
jgi:hypothetical protein